MKKFKVLMVLALLCVNVLSMTYITAKEISDHHEHEIEPSAIAPCPYGNGIHQMWAKAISSVKDINTGRVLILDAGLYQCANCKEVIVVEGSPEFGLPLFRYIYQQSFYDSYYNGSLFVVYIATESSINYTSSNTLPGYQFLKSTPYSNIIDR